MRSFGHGEASETSAGGEPPEGPRRQPLWPNLLLLAAATVLTLAAAEAGLWVLGRYQPEPRTYVGEHKNRDGMRYFVADEHAGWRMYPGTRFEWTEGKPTTYLADERGFRTGSRQTGAGERPQRPRRIAVVGDSFLWGFGVDYEESCGRRLETRLESSEVLNRAMPAFGVDQIWLALRHWALPESPDLVIAGLFIDDFNRSFFAYRDLLGFNKPTFRLAGGALVERTAGDRPGRLVRWLERRSRVFTLLRRGDRWAGRNWGAGSWWSLNAAFLDAMRADAEQAGVPLLFVRIPFPETIHFPALGAYMRRHGASYIDLGVWSEDERRRYYFEHDHHMDADGHAALAALLEQWIREHHPELG